jgi:hypothetical protein
MGPLDYPRFVGRVAFGLLASLSFLAVGCASPSKANIELRKQIAGLNSEMTKLNRQHDADVATIRGLQQQHGVLPTLPPERLANLVTVHSIEISKQTTGSNLNHEQAPDNGVRVYVRLYDGKKDVIKAAGSFTVEVFDLAAGPNALIAKRDFPVEEIYKHWYPMPYIYSYVLVVPLSDPPKHTPLTVRVTYRDDLTQRVFTAQGTAKMTLPTTTAPTSKP